MKTYVWASPMRLFHWFLFVSIVCAYIVVEENELLNVHVAFGYVVLTLLLFRIIYGFAGPAYSRFKDFPVRISSVRPYLSNMKIGKQKFPGHNPVSAIVMFAILADILLVVITGIFALSAEGYGLLKGINLQGSDEFFKETHELFANILIGLVLIHLAGLVVDFYTNRKTGTLKSIFTGYKNIDGKEVKESKTLNVFIAFMIVIAISVFAYTIKSDYPQGEKTEHHENEAEDDD